MGNWVQNGRHLCTYIDGSVAWFRNKDEIKKVDTYLTWLWMLLIIGGVNIVMMLGRRRWRGGCCGHSGSFRFRVASFDMGSQKAKVDKISVQDYRWSEPVRPASVRFNIRTETERGSTDFTIIVVGTSADATHTHTPTLTHIHTHTKVYNFQNSHIS